MKNTDEEYKRKLDRFSFWPSSRSDRFVTEGKYWYFKTREGSDFGPFISKGQAKKALKDFLHYRIQVDEIRARWGMS